MPMLLIIGHLDFGDFQTLYFGDILFNSLGPCSHKGPYIKYDRNFWAFFDPLPPLTAK